MFNFNSLVLAALVACSQAETFRMSPRSLSFAQIAGYEPRTSVTDHNAIDLDQKAMEDQLAEETEDAFARAKRIYEQGGNSKSYAVLTTSALPVDAAEGDAVSGVDTTGLVIAGMVYEKATAGATLLKVQYKTSESQADYSRCQVGGLVEPNTVGCFNATGSITILGSTPITYTYNITTGNDNGRTLQYFSTTAETKMRHNYDGAYFQDFQKFYDYYGATDYSDQYVEAAFQGKALTMNGKTFDFSGFDLAARGEAIKKASAYMSTAMYAIRELEDAIDICKTGANGDDDNSVDEGAAFYTGSLEGVDGSGTGVLMYSLAEKRCANFKTCGEKGNDVTGKAKVNLDIFKELANMNSNYAKLKCEDARTNKETIAKKMFVPLVQGTLRYAFIRSTDGDGDAKDEAEGATFAAAVLPVVANCSADAAATIYNNMKPGSGKADFASVKQAFESNYGCMGISCADVGGYYDSANAQYFDGASPCGGSGGGDSGANVGLAVGLTIGGLVLVGLIFMFVKRRKASAVEFKSDNNQHV